MKMSRECRPNIRANAVCVSVRARVSLTERETGGGGGEDGGGDGRDEVRAILSVCLQVCRGEGGREGW